MREPSETLGSCGDTAGTESVDPLAPDQLEGDAEDPAAGVELMRLSRAGSVAVGIWLQ